MFLVNRFYISEAKRIGKARDAAFEAAVVRLWAEDKAGRLLIEMREKGERKKQGGDRAKSQGVTLPKLGVTKMQSSRWMEIAEIEHAIKLAYIAKAEGTDETRA